MKKKIIFFIVMVFAFIIFANYYVQAVYNQGVFQTRKNKVVQNIENNKITDESNINNNVEKNNYINCINDCQYNADCPIYNNESECKINEDCPRYNQDNNCVSSDICPMYSNSIENNQNSPKSCNKEENYKNYQHHNGKRRCNR